MQRLIYVGLGVILACLVGFGWGETVQYVAPRHSVILICEYDYDFEHQPHPIVTDYKDHGVKVTCVTR